MKWASASPQFWQAKAVTEEGLAGELERKEMVPFAEYSIDLLPGQFLEVFNGMLWYRGSNG